MFLADTVTCVVAFAVPSTVVSDVNRPVTLLVVTFAVVASEKLPSASIGKPLKGRRKRYS